MNNEKAKFYDEFADEFDEKMYMYDTNKRIEIIFDDLLIDEDLAGKTVLDAGCGTGWFSQRAYEIGARVTALDVGEKLLSKVRQKCDVTTIVGDILKLDFPDNSFDYVISSDVIEHVTNPGEAVKELVRVVKKNGIIALTTPNRIWYFSIWLANKLNLRPYKGLENWAGYYELKKWFLFEDCEILIHKGFHIGPLFFSGIFFPFLRFMDNFGDYIGFIMLNTAIKVKKR